MILLTTTNTYSLLAGPAVFFNSSVGAELTAGFYSLNTHDFTTNSFKINIGFQIYLKKE